MRSRRVTGLVALLVALIAVSAGPAFAARQGESLRGELIGPDDKPVKGVTITVEADGETVGKDTTSGDGTWEVKLPKPGQYDVTLDTETLPEDLQPANTDTLSDVAVTSGDDRTVLFPLEEKGAAPGKGEGKQPPPGAQGDGGVAPQLNRVAQATVDGIKLGLIIAITSVGLSLVFGTTNMINFAHGELVTLGAVLAFFFNVGAAGPGFHLIPAAFVAIAIGGFAGAALEKGMWAPLRYRGIARIQLFIITIGLSLFIRHVILVFFGERPLPYRNYALQPAMTFGPISITPRDLVVSGLSLLVLFGVAFMLQRTRIGKAMRAVSDDRDLAEASGIDVDRVVLFVWILAGMLAAVGGVFYGMVEIVSWDMGFALLLFMFAGVILGGLGTAYGAMVGSLVIGLIANLSTLYFPLELQFAWALFVLIIVLLVRPQGIFGRAERVG